MKNNLCIIPARGNSKRIPGKNINDFLGKPIIAYSIEAAIGSGLFEEVMVSTDSQQVADIAKRYGAKVPFLRSDVNSDDLTTTASVLSEVIVAYLEQGREFEQCCCLYPAAPLISSIRLKEAYSLLNEKQFDSIIPVARFSNPILRSLKIDDGKVAMNWPENLNVRSQDLDPAYYDVGQFYWFNIAKFNETHSIINDNCGAFELSENEVQDIDNPSDWTLAELKYQMLNSKGQ